MGNTLNCCPSSRSVKIYGEKGRLMQFYRPVLASKLMRENPHHVVVYSVVNARPTNVRVGKVSKNNVRIRVVRPDEVLRIGKVYFLVHIPEQYTAKFAKYFAPQSLPSTPNRVKNRSSPLASPLSSICSTPPGSPLLDFLESPTGGPNRWFYAGTASPLSLYNQSPLTGSTRNVTRPVRRQPVRNSATTTRTQSPARPNTPTNQDMMRSIVNQHFHRDLNRSMLSSGRPSTPIQQKAFQQSQSSHRRVAQSPVKPGTQPTHDTLANILFQSQQQRGSSSPYHHANGSSSPYQHANKSPRKSPGRPMSPGTHDTLRNILQQQQRSSSLYIKNSPLRSPRRQIKPGAGKASRPRRGGLRSPSHHKSVFSKSPVRNMPIPVVVKQDVGDQWLSLEFKDPTGTRMKSSDAAPPQARTPPRLGLRAPPPILGGTFRRRLIPRLLRPRSIRSGWAPGLQSISEDSPVRGSAEALIKHRPAGFSPHFLKIQPARSIG